MKYIVLNLAILMIVVSCNQSSNNKTKDTAQAAEMIEKKEVAKSVNNDAATKNNISTTDNKNINPTLETRKVTVEIPTTSTTSNTKPVPQNTTTSVAPINVYDDANFMKSVLEKNGLVIVDFWAPWCGPCVKLGPTIEKLADEYKGQITVGKLNVDNNPVASQSYNISSIPAVLYFKNGQLVDKVLGLNAKSVYEDKIKQHL